MRNFLFHTVANIIGIQIIAITWLADTARRNLGRVGHFLMNLINPTLLKAYNSVLEQEQQKSELSMQSLELRLLAGASQVRDHAEETGEWTDHHSEAINAIGASLLSDIQWEEESVHQYLREVVESIDGLEYEVEDW